MIYEKYYRTSHEGVRIGIVVIADAFRGTPIETSILRRGDHDKSWGDRPGGKVGQPRFGQPILSMLLIDADRGSQEEESMRRC